jgi:iron complex transport system substrate-binding protein
MRWILALLLADNALLLAQQRVVSTAPGITETLYALGAGARIVGVSTYCRYPAEAASKPKVGTYLQPNVEAILRLKPDLVILEKLAPQALEQLARAGVTVRRIDTGDVATNLKMMEDIAEAVNLRDLGLALSRKVRAELRSIAASTAGKKKKRVVFVVGRTPGRLDGIIAVGSKSYLNELIDAAGGVNVFADSLVSYPKVSLESLIRLQPDLIIDMGDMAETVGVSAEKNRAVEALWRSRPELKARIHAVASDIFVVPGPRMVDAALEFRRLIHGR